MGIEFQNNIFHLYNERISYCILLSKHNDLLHMHFGKKVCPEELDFIIRGRASFSAYETGDDSYSLDVLPQEYPMYGAQDLRSPALCVEVGGAGVICKLRYKCHEIFSGKPVLDGLPSTYMENENEGQTLKVTIADTLSGLEVDLFYTVYDGLDVICRHSVVCNTSKDTFELRNVASMSIDYHDYDYKYMHLHGAWIREKHVEIADVKKGFQGIDSKRGASGVCENPFMAFMRRDATEDYGDVYGFSLVYSGNFKIMAEVEQYGTMRVQAGINPNNFCWHLQSGEEFVTPEVVMVYSNSGLGGMSRTYHRLYRSRLCRGKFRDEVRPILINNWEATYFDFTEEKLLSISERAAQLGMELFVLDDGWFGKRNDDRRSLGDWYVNKEKLPNGLEGLADKVNAQGIDFGLWIEPEMISPDSDLYQKHPDWALQVPGREAHKARHQLILDMGRPEVCEYIISTMSEILASANIKYVKWDMNRNMTDARSALLALDRQGEVAHRYILGVYKLMDALTSNFPHILFEGCSGGAGRNDPGVLHYMPQNWGSDDTDAVERMYIQYGASMVYPASSVCAHVSVVPNHQMDRVTPMKLRAEVAMSGALGYEFDLSKLTEEECSEVQVQVSTYKRIRDVVCMGDMYRLMNPFEGRSAAWMFVTEDKRRAVVFYFNKLAKPNAELRRLKLKGLDENHKYSIDGRQYTGATLMNYGLYLPEYEKDFESLVWEIDSENI